METKRNPSPFDCYDKADPDEPMFVLLGRDPLAGPLVALWAQARARMRPGGKVDAARECGVHMHNWCSRVARRQPASASDILTDEMLKDELRLRGYHVASPALPEWRDEPVHIQQHMHTQLVDMAANWLALASAFASGFPEQVASVEPMRQQMAEFVAKEMQP